MLGTGTLHCDPHPGNLLRTVDGRLCILDWGLVTCLDPDLQLTLIEHVAHITARDYAKLPSDLVKLGFVPEGQTAAALDAGVVDLLAATYAKRAEGGGFANFDVPALFDELRSLSADAGGSIFQIPPYFAYIAKAFATLEGIGLSADPTYSIINETLPYIAQRIVTDPSPRTAGALGTFVFGDAKEDAAARVLDAERVGSLLDGVRRYSTAAAALAAEERGNAATAATARPSTAAAAAAAAAADALLDVLADDTPLAALVAEQAVLVLGAASRDWWASVRQASGTLPGAVPAAPTAATTSATVTATGTMMATMTEPTLRGDQSVSPAARSRLGALIDPLGLFRTSALVINGGRDEAALQAATKLAAVATDLLAEDPDAVGRSGPPLEPRAVASALVAKAWQRRDDVQVATRRLTLEALDQAVARMQRGAAI